ncbi:hypothetical protein CHS0354_018052, partial [Potamilus streckersoni]
MKSARFAPRIYVYCLILLQILRLTSCTPGFNGRPPPPFFPVGGGVAEGIFPRLGSLVGPLSPFGLAGIPFARGREPTLLEPPLAPMFPVVVGRT